MAVTPLLAETHEPWVLFGKATVILLVAYLLWRLWRYGEGLE